MNMTNRNRDVSGLVMKSVGPASPPPPSPWERPCAMPIGRGPNCRSWGQGHKNRSSRKTDSPKTYSLTENQFSGKTYFHTLASGVGGGDGGGDGRDGEGEEQGAPHHDSS